MLSKSQIKLISSLKQKKYRTKVGLFVAEGPKVISELSQSGWRLHSLFTTEDLNVEATSLFYISEIELTKISSLKTANTAVAIFEIPVRKNRDDQGLILALDAIRDPGNLGTIIRLCDWFGVKQLICSLDTVDCYNPKVVQATMGSIARIDIRYVDLLVYLRETKLPVIGGVLNGSNVYSEELPEQAILIMGNEANGISDEVVNLLTKKITIPQFGDEHNTESLNAATATAILLSEFKRPTEK